MTIRVAWLGICAALTAGCGGPGEEARSGLHDEARAGEDWFVERASETGLDFIHFNGAAGDYYYPEILPPGAGLLDYDNDGDLDVYLVQGRVLGRDGDPAGSPVPPPQALPLKGRLYRNDLAASADGAPVLRFTDVTARSGIDADGFGLGVAAGDVDNDGWTDLFLTNFGPSALYLNRGDGTFRDASADSGVDGAPGFGVSAAFVDYNRDGWLDLYVGHNVNYALDNTIECSNVTGANDYCPPETYGGTPDHLYRNTGGGRFVDVSDTALLGGRFGPALGVAAADYDGDGWIDIYVANDATENLLWLNQRDGTFRDVALLSGAALSGMGLAEASMGVDAGDYDNDGDEDLFMTHITNEGNNLYVNDGTASFRDRSTISGLGAGSLPYTGWGTTWFDYDNDGWLDLLAVNGAVIATPGPADRPFPYDQRKSLFRNLGDGAFEDVTGSAGAAFDLSETGRGAAFGDIDNDGDVDVVVGNDAGPVRLLVNRIGNRRHWLGLRLVGAGGRDMLGARVAVRRPGEATLWRRARSDGSYASANDPRVIVGLGESDVRPAVEVRWPDGQAETWEDVEIDRWTTLEQGTGGGGVTPLRRSERAAASISAGCLSAVLGLALPVGGCSASDESMSSDSGTAAERAVAAPAASDAPGFCGEALPDLSRVGESVQARIRDRHEALPPRGERAGVPVEQQAEMVGVLGMTFMAAWFTEEAEPCLREASALVPADVRWPYYLAQLHRDRGALEESAAFFEQALRIRPEDPTTLFWLGDIRLEQGRPDAAEPLFARALALFPSSLSARYGLAQTALLEEDYRRAADLLEEILARDPEIGAVHYPLGMAYRGLGDDAKAEAHLRRRENAEIRPVDPLMAALDSLLPTAGAYENSGLEALDRQEWPAAIEQFRQGLERDPDDPGLRHRLGTALFMIGDLDGAMAEFQRVVRTTPDYFPSHYSIGVLLQETGRHAAALERFRTALRHRPGDDAVHLRMAISLRHAGDPESSLSYYELVLRSSPDALEARFGYAMGLVQLGRFREAHDRLATAMDAFPQETSFAHALARLLAAAPDPTIRNGRRAMTLVEQVMEAEPEPTIDLGETMAMTLAELGRFDEAADVQRALIGAADLANLPDVVRRLTGNLRRYERGEPCRTPWPADAMP